MGCAKEVIGPYKGTVINIQTPDLPGKVFIHVPALGIKKWALPKGGMKNNWEMPNLGDPVWVSFQDGKPGLPVWEHGWVIKDAEDVEIKQNPPTNDDPGIKLIKWKNMKVIMNDSFLELKDEDNRSFIRLSPEENTGIEINSNKNLTVSSKGTITLNAESININCKGNYNFVSPNNVSMGSGKTTEIVAIESIIMKASELFQARVSEEIEIKRGLTPADESGFASDATSNELTHPIKNLIEAANNEMKASATNTIEAITNVLDGINKIGSKTSIQPLVLGTEFITFFTGILQMLVAHTHPTPAGPATPSVELIAQTPGKIADLVTTISKKNFTE